jgi:hypothetical protein
MILCRYLDQRNAKHDLTWLKWSSDHADLARVFWPIVARVARAGLYVTTPGLFETAREGAQPQDLRTALHQRLMADALVLAKGRYQLAEYDAAIRTCSFVLDTVNRERETGAENTEQSANVETVSTDIDDVAKANEWLNDIAIKSLRLRSEAYTKTKRSEQAKADLRRIAELQQGP